MKIDKSRLAAWGERLCSDSSIRYTPVAGAWELTREAASTLKELPGLPRLGFPRKSAWPDFMDENFFGMLRERLTDAVEGEVVHIRIVPTAAAIDRCEALWWLWREYAFPRLGKRRELLRLVWLYAGGVRPAKIKSRFGVSRYRLHRAKMQGCERVAYFLACNNCNNSRTVPVHDQACYA